MKVFFGSSKAQLEGSVLTMGNFDGLHRGHQKLISFLCTLSKRIKKPSVLVTYFPHPLRVLRPRVSIQYLLSFKDFKLELKKLGLNYLVIENFTQELSRMEPECYLKDSIIKPFKPQFLVLGKNFSFGNQKTGTLLKLKSWEKKYSYQLKSIPLLSVKASKKIPVSSTKIKEYLQEGDLERASLFLGRTYFLRGKIEKGKQRGRKIGYPTLNLKTKDLFLPRNGVYESSFLMDKKHYFSITNIGMDPTFEGEEKNSETIQKKIETHALISKEKRNQLFNDTVYGKEMILFLYRFLRREKKFKNSRELKAQIKLDITKVQKMK